MTQLIVGFQSVLNGPRNLFMKMSRADKILVLSAAHFGMSCLSACCRKMLVFVVTLYFVCKG
jgi:uncharacterized membrane protein